MDPQIKEKTSLVNVYLSYGLDPNQKKDNSASNEIALSDQQIKLEI
jgi:hypothetical protein